MIERFRQFLREVRAEFSKISWPSRLETIGLTVLVITMLIVLTGVIFFYDTVFSAIIYGVLLNR